MASKRHTKKAPARRRHARTSRPDPTPPHVPAMLRAGGNMDLVERAAPGLEPWRGASASVARPSKPAPEKPQSALLQLRKNMEHTYANMCVTLDAADRFLVRTGTVSKDSENLTAGAAPTAAEGPHLHELENLARAMDYGTARLGRIVGALEEIG